MKKIFFTLMVCLFANIVFAQTWKADLQKADSLYKLDKDAQAIALYTQILPQIEKDSTQMSEVYLNTSNRLASSLIYVGKKEETEVFLLKQLALCKQFGEETKEYATILNHLGTFYLPYVAGNEPLKSEQYLLKALALRKKILGEKHQEYARSLNNLANLYSNLGNYAKSETYYLQSLAIYKETLGEKHQFYAGALNGLAILYRGLGNYAKAETYYLQALTIYKETLGEKHQSYARYLNNLAILYRTLGNYAKAETYYLQALTILKEILGEKHKDYARSLNSLAIFYKDLGNYAKAEPLYLQSLTIYKETLGEKHINYAGSLNNLAILYSDLGNYAKAETYNLQALKIFKETLGEKHQDYGRSLMNLALLYSDLGNYAKAETYYLQALTIYKETLGEKHQEYANSLNNLATLYKDLGNYAKAKTYYLQALTIRKETLGEKHQNYIYTLNHLANLYQTQNQFVKSLPYYLQSIQSSQNLITLNFPILSEKEKTDYYSNKIKNYFSNFYSFAVQNNLSAELYNAQLFAKGILLNSTQKMKNRILNSKDSLLIQEYDFWNSLKLSIAKYQQMTQEELQKTGLNLDSLENLANEKEKALSRKSESFASLSDMKSTTWKDIQKKLKKNEAAIEIVRVQKFGVEKIVSDTTDYHYRDSLKEFPKYPLYGLTDTVYYAALIVKKESKEPELVLLTNGNDLERKTFGFYKNSVKFKRTDKESYQKYWQNIKNNLQGIRKVYFSPDGIYNQINLNILQNPDNQQYILDEIEIQQLTNTKEILAFADKKTLQGFEDLVRFKAVLFGRPAYDMDSVAYLVNVELSKENTQNYALRDMRDLRQGVFSDLLGTEREIVLIDSILKSRKLKTEKYLLSEATEQKIKALQSPNILHIATHGFFIADSTSKNPMLNSGVLLAGVSNYYRSEEKPDTDDGILTSQEAQNLSLDHTDLVVLSACETGLGEIKNGEGVYGLQRAFKAAGAKSILMSHWKVDDRVTQELMTSFYEKWTKTGKKRQSFADAQKEIRSKYTNPYYWGAFVLVGE